MVMLVQSSLACNLKHHLRHPDTQHDWIDNVSDTYPAPLLPVDNSDACDPLLVTTQRSMPSADGPDPNVQDLRQLRCTISRGAVPVSNINLFRMLRLVQITGDRVLEPARRNDDEDSWKVHSQSNLEDLDNLFGFDSRTMGSASTTLLYQNSDIPTKVEQSVDGPLPFLRPSTVSICHCDVSACPGNPAHTILEPVNILQDTAVRSVKDQLQLHQEILQYTTFRGAVPDNNRLQLIFDLSPQRSFYSCPSQVAVVDYSTALVDPAVTEELSHCHGDRTTSRWTGDVYHAQPPQESLWPLTVLSHVTNPIWTQQLPQQPSILGGVIRVTNHAIRTPSQISLQLDVNGGPDGQLQRHMTISSGTVPSYILGSHCCSSADPVEIYGQEHLSVDIDKILFPTSLCDCWQSPLAQKPPKGWF